MNNSIAKLPEMYHHRYQFQYIGTCVAVSPQPYRNSHPTIALLWPPSNLFHLKAQPQTHKHQIQPQIPVPILPPLRSPPVRSMYPFCSPTPCLLHSSSHYSLYSWSYQHLQNYLSQQYCSRSSCWNRSSYSMHWLQRTPGQKMKILRQRIEASNLFEFLDLHHSKFESHNLISREDRRVVSM